MKRIIGGAGGRVVYQWVHLDFERSGPVDPTILRLASENIDALSGALASVSAQQALPATPDCILGSDRTA